MLLFKRSTLYYPVSTKIFSTILAQLTRFFTIKKAERCVLIADFLLKSQKKSIA